MPYLSRAEALHWSAEGIGRGQSKHYNSGGPCRGPSKSSVDDDSLCSAFDLFGFF